MDALMNLCEFPEGAIIRSHYSGKVYRVYIQQGGISYLLPVNGGLIEIWNACNNRHFIPADYVSLGIMSLL